MSDLWLGMVATVLVLALLAGIKGLSMFDEWLERRQTVKASAAAVAHVLSSEPPQPSPIAPSGLQTDGRQTDRPAERPKPTDAEVLTLFTVFKEAGYNRDEARAILRPFGVAVDNNLYSQAKGVNIYPPGDPTIEVGAPEPLVAQPAGR